MNTLLFLEDCDCEIILIKELKKMVRKDKSTSRTPI